MKLLTRVELIHWSVEGTPEAEVLRTTYRVIVESTRRTAGGLPYPFVEWVGESDPAGVGKLYSIATKNGAVFDPSTPMTTIYCCVGT